MARPRKISVRQATRIAARRSGAFNTREYREGVRQRRELAGEIGFWGGLALTVMTGGAALPLAAIGMAPKLLNAAADHLNTTPKAPAPTPKVAKPKKPRATKPQGGHPSAQGAEVRRHEPLVVEKPAPAPAPAPVVEAPVAPKAPKKEPKNHQTKAQEKKQDPSLEARKRRLEKLRRDNRQGASAERLALFRETK